jgi:hypothetical protein
LSWAFRYDCEDTSGVEIICHFGILSLFSIASEKKFHLTFCTAPILWEGLYFCLRLKLEFNLLFFDIQLFFRNRPLLFYDFWLRCWFKLLNWLSLFNWIINWLWCRFKLRSWLCLFDRLFDRLFGWLSNWLYFLLQNRLCLLLWRLDWEEVSRRKRE